MRERFSLKVGRELAGSDLERRGREREGFREASVFFIFLLFNLICFFNRDTKTIKKRLFCFFILNLFLARFIYLR